MDGDLHPFGQYAHFVGGEDERINQEEQLKENLENHNEDGTDISEDESKTMLSIPVRASSVLTRSIAIALMLKPLPQMQWT